MKQDRVSSPVEGRGEDSTLIGTRYVDVTLVREAHTFFSESVPETEDCILNTNAKELIVFPENLKTLVSIIVSSFI